MRFFLFRNKDDGRLLSARDRCTPNAYRAGFTLDPVAIFSLRCISRRSCSAWRWPSCLVARCSTWPKIRKRTRESPLRFFRGPDFDVEPETRGFKVAPMSVEVNRADSSANPCTLVAVNTPIYVLFYVLLVIIIMRNFWKALKYVLFVWRTLIILDNG